MNNRRDVSTRRSLRVPARILWQPGAEAAQFPSRHTILAATIAEGPVMSKISRRAFLEGTSAGLVIAAAPAATDEVRTIAAAAAADSAPAPRTSVRFVVNGVERRIEVEDRWTLVETLRDRLGLTGTKVGCDRGECGACTVLLDGRPLYSCSYLAVWADGRSIRTIEGLADNNRLHPLQQAFIDHDGPQCGFCTSGQLMSAVALLAHTPSPSAADVRTALVGNLCRCSNYNRYVESVVAAGRASSAPTAADDGDRGAAGRTSATTDDTSHTVGPELARPSP